jgi:hypothetical protein
MSKGRRPPAPEWSPHVTTRSGSYEPPANAIQPDGFGIEGFSDETNGFVCITPEGATPLVFDLETAKVLADAIKFSIGKIEQGMKQRKHAAKRTTTPSA